MATEKRDPGQVDMPRVLLEMTETLKEIALWTRVANYDAVRSLLEKSLDSAHKRYVYQSTDGELTRKELVQRSGGAVGEGTVSGWWAQWDRLGITQSRPDSRGVARRARCFDLQDFGIVVPTAEDLKPAGK